MATLYEQVGGYDRVRALAQAWHERCLADDIMSHPFSHPGQHDHIDRLASYWAEQLGGPPLYTSAFGDETSVVRLHSGNGEHAEMDERAVACFSQALDDIGLVEAGMSDGGPENSAAGIGLRTELEAWFTHETEQMGRYPRSPDDVPDGLRLPVWSGGEP